MKTVLAITALALLVSACGHDNGKCNNCGTYPHPNAYQYSEVNNNCQIVHQDLSNGAPTSTTYSCTKAAWLSDSGPVSLVFSPACQVQIVSAPLNEPLTINSTCPSFP